MTFSRYFPFFFLSMFFFLSLLFTLVRFLYCKQLCLPSRLFIRLSLFLLCRVLISPVHTKKNTFFFPFFSLFLRGGEMLWSRDHDIYFFSVSFVFLCVIYIYTCRCSRIKLVSYVRTTIELTRLSIQSANITAQ